MSDLFRTLQHPVLLGVAGVVSIVLFVLALVGVPWIVTRLPVDYFVSQSRPRRGGGATSSLLWRALRNVAGVVVLTMGIAMLILPGQGVLTILVGLGLVDFPGKWALERRIARARPVFWALNRLRRRAGQPPLVMEEDGDDRAPPSEPPARVEQR